jgi:hypothetical protein
MSTEQVTAPAKAKGGRPVGYKPVKKDEVKAGIEVMEDGTHLIIKIPKKMASKILLKDLF